jgi:uncharacterized protein (DUF983 family)
VSPRAGRSRRRRAILASVDHADPKPLTIPRLLRRGVLRRCPLCGAGDVFASFLEVRERCPRCNFPLRREEGHWLGAVGINTIVTLCLMLVTMVMAFALTWDDRRALPIFVSMFVVAGVTPLVFFGSSQTLWSAIELAMNPLEPRDDIDPRWIPPRSEPR